ncbi:MAG: potassium/proton antiporter [Oscillospiraceae bacterium]|nr:potassium/proton antiporter [Oscillospiraceae bacterium]
MELTVLIVAVIILACIAAHHVSGRFGIPMLLVFIGMGMLFGSDGLVKIPFDDYSLAETGCSVALIFIMFYGGFGTNWNKAKPVAVKSLLLSSMGVVFTALLTGLFCHLVLGMELISGMLVGACLGSTDAATVFSILRAKRLNLKYNTASLLELESGSNDPFAYMLTMIVLSLMHSSGTAWDVAYMLFAQLFYGAGFGVIIALLAWRVLKRFTFVTAGLDSVFMVAVALLAFAAPAAVGGNGYLSAYIVGIYLGNRPISGKRNLVHFFDGVTGLLQMLVFFMLGLLAFPSKLPQVVIPGILIALFMTLVARPVSVFGILAPFRCKLNQMLLVSFSGLRGVASIVFAIMAMAAADVEHYDLFHTVFLVVLFSLLLQGSLIPMLARMLKMIDNTNNVLTTFNDYSEELPVQFIKLSVNEGDRWDGKQIKEIDLPPETLIAMILRDGQRIVPKGFTVLNAGDTAVLCAPACNEDAGINLTEVYVNKESVYCGLMLSELPPDDGNLVVLIKRGNHVIIPRGRTVFKDGDLLVINSAEG